MTNMDHLNDHLNEQFLNYQLLLKEDVPSELETTNSDGDTLIFTTLIFN